jgi:ABC-type phosphate transport system permease subunit
MATQVAAQANLFKRKVRSKRVVLDWVMTGLIFASSIFAIVVLASILYYVFVNGIERFNWQTS